MDKEGERMKRKMENNEEENEEEKMEKFFALIRSTRVARGCISGKMDRISEGEELKKVANDAKKLKAPAVAGWFPTFQPEDFVADFRAKPAAVHAAQPSPSNITTSTGTTTTTTTTTDNVSKERKVKEGDDNLNLKLSL